MTSCPSCGIGHPFDDLPKVCAVCGHRRGEEPRLPAASEIDVAALGRATHCPHCNTAEGQYHFADCPLLIGGPRLSKVAHLGITGGVRNWWVTNVPWIERVEQINRQNHLDLLTERDPHRAIP